MLYDAIFINGRRRRYNFRVRSRGSGDHRVVDIDRDSALFPRTLFLSLCRCSVYEKYHSLSTTISLLTFVQLSIAIRIIGVAFYFYDDRGVKRSPSCEKPERITVKKEFCRQLSFSVIQNIQKRFRKLYFRYNFRLNLSVCHCAVIIESRR